MKHTALIPTRLTLALATTLVLSPAITGSAAETIYRETFGNLSTSRVTPNVYGWQAYLADGTFFDTTGSGFGVDTASNLGAPGNVANVNAGPNADGTFDAQAASRIFWNGNRRFVWTPEYSFTPSDYQPGSISFNFWLGNQNAVPNTDPVRVAIRVNDGIGDAWYVSSTSFTSGTVAGSSFNTLAEFKTLAFDPTAANWQVLNFDGTYNGGGTPIPGDPGAIKASSTAPLSLGGFASQDLSGMITGFGVIFVPASGDLSVNPTGNIRFDSFEILATPVPEPTSIALAAMGILGITFLRRRS